MSCRMHADRCICPVIEAARAETEGIATRVALVMHHREFRKPTNTGVLAKACLPGVELLLRGLPDTPLSGDSLISPERRTLVLFPADHARPLDEVAAEDPRPVTLVVPDGNWRQAAKVPNRLPALRSVPRVVLPEGPRTRYRLREENRIGGLATLEAIARALGVLEGPRIRGAVERVFDAMVEATLTTRGYGRSTVA